MSVPTRQNLEEGPILDPLFVEHYGRFSLWPARAGARWMAAKMRMLETPPNARVLDIGCGPGWLARFLAGQFPAMQFVGVDAAPPMIAWANRGLREAGEAGRVKFVAGAGENLPFGAGRFDLVICLATLHHVANPVAVFDEMDRVLAAKGRVIISDLNRALPRLLWPIVVAMDRFERWRRPAALRGLAEGFINSYRAAYAPDEIRDFLKRSSLGRRVQYYPRWFQHWIQTPTSQVDNWRRSGIEKDHLDRA